MKKFNERLRELREDNDLTQRELAKLINVDQRSLSFYEIGKYEPNIETIIKIAQILNTTTDYLLGISNKKEPYKRKK